MNLDGFVFKRMLAFAVRRALTLGGAYLIDRGWVEGDVWAQVVPGLALVAADFAWSLYEKIKTKNKVETLTVAVEAAKAERAA